ncbi:cysteine desulfurase [Waddlia chondrophila 2032/99]|uniref:cysteine desulfurase n=2 Tax=Waddlia chondrophila TaxID=71667 RepID=D6YTK2_WADCW|nr:cysteine desulfurase [Waddlia chondrophila]ADI37463.1 Cysteine desulfurase, SufS subfamily [Waddlia chondrophila WSU 86-1044]CCB90779.1 cysteine desulfurase [Waddlia chondrophila 2032/99]
MADDLSHLRNDFPMLSKQMHGKPLVYLDSAATAQKPQCVIDTINHFYTSRYGTVHRAIYELAAHATEEYQKVREKTRAFIGARSGNEIVYTRGNTESINMVAYSYGKAFIQPGDEILISEMEHHSNIVPWQILCEDRGALLKVIPVLDNGDLDLVAYRHLLSERTKLVAVAHVSNTLGTVNPIKSIVADAHEAGAHVLVDGAQAIPHSPVNVSELGCDFYTFSVHKAFGPTGIGILYGKEELLNQLPPCQGGGDMIDKVAFEKTTYQKAPLRFEAGTPMIAEVIGLGAAIDYLEGIGMRNIQEWEHQLLVYAEEQLKGIDGLQIIGRSRNKAAIISFVVDGIHHLDLGTFLDLQGIAVRTGHHCTQPLMKRFNLAGTTRASFALYNHRNDVDRFVNALKSVIQKLHAY